MTGGEQVGGPRMLLQRLELFDHLGGGHFDLCNWNHMAVRGIKGLKLGVSGRLQRSLFRITCSTVAMCYQSVCGAEANAGCLVSVIAKLCTEAAGDSTVICPVD